MLFHVIDGVSHYGSSSLFAESLNLSKLLFAFPRALANVYDKYPKCFDLHRRVKIRPRIAAYLQSDRRQKFSNGLYRYYKELDDPEKDVEEIVAAKGGMEVEAE